MAAATSLPEEDAMSGSHVTWSPAVLERALETGLALDVGGNLVAG